jgi:hypothetical protein
MNPVSEIRIKVSPWYYVRLTQAQSLVIETGNVSRIDEPGFLYQSRKESDAVAFAAKMATSTGILFSRCLVAQPAVDSRGRAISHERKPANAHKGIDPHSVRRAAYAWEKA